MPIQQHLRQERPPRVSEQHERQAGLLVVNALCEGPHRVPRGAEAAGTQSAELAVIAAPLRETGATVAAMVVGVDGVAVGDEGVDQGTVAPRVLADPVQQLYDGARGVRLVHVVDDGDAVGIDELGHGPSIGGTGRPRRSGSAGAVASIPLARLMS